MSSIERGLAAGLNFVIWGAGYLYRRDRTVMGGFLLAGYLLIHWYWIIEIGGGPALTGRSILVVVHLLLSAGLIFDVYTLRESTREAKTSLLMMDMRFVSCTVAPDLPI